MNGHRPESKTHSGAGRLRNSLLVYLVDDRNVSDGYLEEWPRKEEGEDGSHSTTNDTHEHTEERRGLRER